MGLIHIYTSSKGGVGKTLQALCTSLYYLRKTGYEVLICDFNCFNADLFQILGLVAEEGSDEHIDGFNIRTISDSNAQARLLYPSNPYHIPESIPMGFYKMISRALSLDLGNFRPSICIVDTGFHFANLDMTPEHWSNIDLKEKHQLASVIFDCFRPFFWFTWTLAALIRQSESDGIASAANTLKGYKNSRDEPWFRDTDNLLHVINPHALMSDRSWKRMLKGAFTRGYDPNLYTIPSLYKLYKRRPAGNVSLKFMQEDTRDSVTKRGELQVAVNEAPMEEHIGRFVRPILESRVYRPLNVLPIPYYAEPLAGYTDSLALKTIKTLDDIEATVKYIYDVVDEYLVALHEHITVWPSP
jgi:hypothetical protein